MKTRISIPTQRTALSRAISHAEKSAPAALGLTTKDQRDLHVSQLRAADETLRWLSQNEPAIREAMASK